MKVEELKIGNYVQGRCLSLCEVKELECDEISCDNLTGKAVTGLPYKPILLTKEWIEKLGFIYDSENMCFEKLGLQIEYNFEKSFWFESGTYNFNVEYVHDLQNLFFAFTRMELTVVDGF